MKRTVDCLYNCKLTSRVTGRKLFMPIEPDSRTMSPFIKLCKSLIFKGRKATSQILSWCNWEAPFEFSAVRLIYTS